MALVLVPVALGRLDRRFFTAVWVIALTFTVLNASPLQLLWVSFPHAMVTALAWVGRCGDVTLLARALLVVAWQVTGWWIVVVCLRRRAADEPDTAGRQAGAAVRADAGATPAAGANGA